MSALLATASKRCLKPLLVSTSLARVPMVCTCTTGSPTRIVPPSRSKWRTMPAIKRLVPPRAHHTPPSFSSLWISA